MDENRKELLFNRMLNHIAEALNYNKVDMRHTFIDGIGFTETELAEYDICLNDCEE